jgi:hypothetical protein
LLRCIIKLSSKRLSAIMAARHSSLVQLGSVAMVRRVFIGLALALAPAAPAAAVIAIAAPAVQPTHVATAKPGTPVMSVPRQPSSDLGFGEIAAALAGMAIIGLVRAAGRQPHSVAA